MGHPDSRGYKQALAHLAYERHAVRRDAKDAVEHALRTCALGAHLELAGCFARQERECVFEHGFKRRVPGSVCRRGEARIGDSDGIVPFEGSGKRTHDAIAGSELHLIAGAPHGCNVSDADEFNQALSAFLAK